MNQIFSDSYWIALGQHALAWLRTHVLTLGTLGQLLVIGACFAFANWVSPALKRRLTGWQPRNVLTGYLATVAGVLARDSLPIVALCCTGGALLVAVGEGWPARLLLIVSNLMLAWVVIRLASSVVRNEFWSKAIAITAWTVAALNIIGLLHSTIDLLNAAAFHVGAIRISALGVVKSIFTLVILLWFANVASDLFERQLKTSQNLTASIQVLLSKIVKVVMITVALLLALSSLGVDLTAFAVFSGAIGVGIGFGLQKIFSNLVSGIILLLDKSIKPGDVIGVADYYGRVNSLGARYVSVLTRDGIEYLIPNEDIITLQVVNWSYSDEKVRLRLPVGVHYKSDVHKAMNLCLEAADEVGRVLKEPKPVCLLRAFGDSSVDLELRFWIRDPMNGRANVCSDILLKIWDKFHEHDIEIPYPQRDIHIRTPSPAMSQPDLQVKLPRE